MAETPLAAPAHPQVPDPDIRPIVFYDGECGLCDRFVQFALRNDRSGRFRFAPLQGETFTGFRDRARCADLSTMVLADEAGVHTRSTATLRLLRHLGGPWGPLAVAGLAIPRPFRDLAYQLVARFRHRLFSSPPACRMPDPAARDRFLP